ncbi:MAG: ferredoxin [Deltaproteobacteria bacterium]|nr:ferredoxin [Candidatus Anaeroferrophillacea bacterium]
MIYHAAEMESEAILAVARLMVVAARTAPKGKGMDRLATMVMTGADKDRVAERMEAIASERDIPFFQRDALNIRQVTAVVVLGTTVAPLGIPFCGFCGFDDCAACAQNHGRCSFNLVDLGIAVGSAVAVAAAHHVDNRIMFSFGRVTLELGLLPEDVKVAYGIPLSVTGKNPFFDR